MAHLRHGRGILCALMLAAALAGCAQTKGFTSDTAVEPTGSRPDAKSEETGASVGPPKRVLLMPADVQLSEITTGGLVEPNAAWTQQGSENISAALRAELGERGLEFVRYEASNDPLNPVAAEHQQILKLHEAVGQSILIHKYLPGQELPTTRNRFDWSLGEGARSLKASYDGDYALFVYARDSFASAGRAAMMVVSALLIGYAPQGGSTEAFASLVDLESGDVVWFNVLTKGTGDLREPDSARSAMDSLLSSMPL